MSKADRGADIGDLADSLENKPSRSELLVLLIMLIYYHFVGRCGAFYGLKWRIQAKIYFSPLK